MDLPEVTVSVSAFGLELQSPAPGPSHTTFLPKEGSGSLAPDTGIQVTQRVRAPAPLGSMSAEPWLQMK